MGMVGHRHISLQISGYHLAPATIAGSGRIWVICTLVRHRRVSGNENRRALCLLHGNGTEGRPIRNDGHIQRLVLHVPSWHDVADIGHHSMGKSLLILSGNIPPEPQMPAPHEDQHVLHRLFCKDFHCDFIISLTGHIQFEGKRNPTMLSRKGRPRLCLQSGDFSAGIQKAAQPILLDHSQVLILIPICRIKGSVQFRHP